MEVFRGLTADDVWCQLYNKIMSPNREVKPQEGRRGSTLEILHCALVIQNPLQRWVVSRRPAINPAFGIAEIFWILAGSNDAKVLNYWFPKLPEFAGKGSHYPGAYGYRLRRHFGIDQIRRACDALTANSSGRQVVLQLWDAKQDLPHKNGSPRNDDVPCNIVSLLKIRNGRLMWTQIMRSNDLHRGLPYNILQFTVLQEIMAGWIGVEVGTFNQLSDSLHVYLDDVPQFSCEPPPQLVDNADSLALDIVQGQALMEEMYHRTTELTKPTINEQELDGLITLDDAPIGYQNLLRVLGAESARRRSRHDQAQSIMKACTNLLITQAWSGWWERLYSNTSISYQ